MTGTRVFVCFLFAVAATMLAAIAYLYFEIRRDIPLAFHTNMALAVLAGLVVPLGAVAAARRLSSQLGTLNAFLVYYGAAATVAVLFTAL